MECEKYAKEIRECFPILKKLFKAKVNDYKKVYEEISDRELLKRAVSLKFGWFTFEIENEEFYMVRQPDSGGQFNYAINEVLALDDEQITILEELLAGKTVIDSIVISNIMDSYTLRGVVIENKITEGIYKLKISEASKALYNFDEDDDDF